MVDIVKCDAVFTKDRGSPKDVARAKAMLSDHDITVEEVKQRMNVAASTLYRQLPGGRSGVAVGRSRGLGRHPKRPHYAGTPLFFMWMIILGERSRMFPICASIPARASRQGLCICEI
ncbi:MAG: hypothetical protein WA459_23485 [Stellaceae bacterium]